MVDRVVVYTIGDDPDDVDWLAKARKARRQAALKETGAAVGAQLFGGKHAEPDSDVRAHADDRGNKPSH